MRRTLLLAARIGLATCALATALAKPAHAEPLGKQGNLVFSAERLMGIYLLHEEGNATLVGLGSTVIGHPYTIARLGFDGFIIDQLSLGGSLSFWNVDPEGPGDSGSGFLLAPRVGYMIEFNDVFGFWPRGGFTFRDLDGDDEFALTLEGNFYATPVEHFAFTFGPVIDLGIAGDRHEARNFGIVSAGLMGWL